MQAANASKTSPSPRRISRRDEDLGLPAAAPEAAGLPDTAPATASEASPASVADLPYQGSSDEEAEERTAGADDGEEDEISSKEGTPEVTAAIQ